MAVLRGAVDPATGFPVVTLEVDARARLWGRLVVVLLAGLRLLWGDVGIGEHVERM
jgi:hypothetical protein